MPPSELVDGGAAGGTTRATCAGCGCVCDDIEVATGAAGLERLERTCPLGDAWFAEHLDDAKPVARIDGEEVGLDEAVDAAAAILAAARLPLVYGLGRTSCEAQRAAVALADAVGAVVDLASGVLDGAAGLAAQTLGLSTATFGEVRDRAEVVVAWRVDPVRTHPRLLPRLRLDRATRAAPGGRARTLVVVDDERTATAAEADVVIDLPSGRDLEALWALRALSRDAALDPGLAAGLPLDDLAALAERLRGCRHGALLHGAGLSGAPSGELNAVALFALVRDLGRHAHVVAVPLRREGNALGAENVLTWQSGYPGAVSFAQGHPRFAPGELRAARLLERGAVDAVLVVASDPLEHLPPPAAEGLRRLPTVVVDSRVTETAAAARVAFLTAAAGVHLEGTVHRMDGVPLALAAPLPSDRPGDEQVLAAIAARLTERGR